MKLIEVASRIVELLDENVPILPGRGVHEELKKALEETRIHGPKGVIVIDSSRMSMEDIERMLEERPITRPPQRVSPEIMKAMREYVKEHTFEPSELEMRRLVTPTEGYDGAEKPGKHNNYGRKPSKF